MRDKNPYSGITVPQWGDSQEKAQIGGQVVNVSATDVRRADHFIPSNKRRGRERGHKKGYPFKAAIRPYSDVKYCTVQEIGAICQCEKKFIKRGAREHQGEKQIGALEDHQF
jgi:hypothetical protein